MVGLRVIVRLPFLCLCLCGKRDLAGCLGSGVSYGAINGGWLFRCPMVLLFVMTFETPTRAAFGDFLCRLARKFSGELHHWLWRVSSQVCFLIVGGFTATNTRLESAIVPCWQFVSVKYKIMFSQVVVSRAAS